MKTNCSIAATTFGCALLAGTSLASAADVTYERLLKPEPHNWLMVHRDYGAQRFSPLDQINASNVKDMKLKFAIAIGGTSANEGLEVTPLVDDGFMYVVDGWGAVYKIDVRSGTHGRILWKMDPGQQRYGRHRGVALWNNLVISTTGKDGRVIATDKETGKIVWDKNLHDQPEVELSSAPLALKDDIIVGASGGDQGVRDWIVSLDPRTGNLKWKTYSIPAPGEPGSETWKDKNNAWQTGGGAFYVTGSYDPQTNLTYWGSGNPVPGYDLFYRPGDNLFTNSAIAFNVATGKMDWYFQYTPNDNRDYDEAGTHILIDTSDQRRGRKIVSRAGRNGFNYTLDRLNGQFLKATQYVNKVTWTKGIDPKTGKPLDYDPSKDLQVYAEPANVVGRQGDAARVSRQRRREQLLAGVLQPAHQAHLHSERRGLRRYHPGPQRAREGQVRRRQLRQSGAAHQQHRQDRSGDRRAEGAQRAALSELGRRSHHCRRRRGHGVARRHDRRLRRPDARGAVEDQRRHRVQRPADDLRGRRQAVHRHRLGAVAQRQGQAGALGGDAQRLERDVDLRVRPVAGAGRDHARS